MLSILKENLGFQVKSTPLKMKTVQEGYIRIRNYWITS